MMTQTPTVEVLPARSLCQSNLEVALDKHFFLAGHAPTTLLVAAEAGLIDAAYRLVGSADFPGNPRLLVVPVPGLPSDSWAVASHAAVIWVGA